MKKSRIIQKNNENADSFRDAHIVKVTDYTCALEEKFISKLESLKEEEKQLLLEKKQLLHALDRLQSKFDVVTDKKSRLLSEIEKKLASKRRRSEKESSHNLFSIVTWGPSWNDGLVFTVMAENDAWAKEVVYQWLNSNGRENHRIDKVLSLVSRDVRGIINVGALLLDV